MVPQLIFTTASSFVLVVSLFILMTCSMEWMDRANQYTKKFSLDPSWYDGT